MRKRGLVLTGLWLPLTCFGLAAAIPSLATADAYGVGSRIPPLSAEDQHGTPHRIDASVRIVLFSRDMLGGDVLKSALEESDPRVVRIEYIDSPELVRRSLDSGSRPEPSDPAPPSD